MLIRHKAACSILYPLFERMLVPMQSRELYMINNGPQRCDGKVAAERLVGFLATLEKTPHVTSIPQPLNNASHGPFSLVPPRPLSQIVCDTTSFTEKKNQQNFISDGKLEVKRVSFQVFPILNLGFVSALQKQRV